MANDIQAYVYHSDAGGSYVIGQNRQVAEQVDAGGNSLTGAVAYNGANASDEMPRNLRPRQVLGAEVGTGYSRAITVLDPSAPLWTGAVDTFVIQDSDGGNHTMQVYNRRGEHQRKRKP